VASFEGDYRLDSATRMFGPLRSDYQLEGRLRIAAVVTAIGSCFAVDGATIQVLFDEDEAFQNEPPFPAIAVGEDILKALETRPVQRFMNTLARVHQGRFQLFALCRPSDMPQDRENQLYAEDILAVPDLVAGASLAREVCELSHGAEFGSEKARPIWNWLMTRRFVLQRVCIDVTRGDGKVIVGIRDV
jgi:hypothetical protein